MLLFGRDSRKPPEWFVEALTSVGGKNRFGLPNFDVVWSETATIERDGKTVLACPGPPCWLLRQWEPPENYGPPDMWSVEEIGEPYPQFGKYEIRQPFRASYVENGILKHEAMELTSLILDFVVPIILQAQDVSVQKRALAMRQLKELEEKRQEARIADALQDAKLQWEGPTSYEKKINKTSIVEQKAYQIEKNWQHAMNFYRQRGRGASIQKPAVELVQ